MNPEQKTAQVIFTLAEWSQIINQLAQSPYAAVAPFIHRIQAQCAEQQTHQSRHNVVSMPEAG